MIEKYGVLLPENGETTIVESKEEAVKLFWERMIKFSLPFFHDTVYVTIQYNDDGLETWFNDQNTEIEKILTLEEQQALIDASREKIEG